MSFKVEFLKTIKSKLDSLPINNGHFLLVEDTSELFVDYNNVRLQISDFIIKNTEEEILSLLTPLDKFYYAKDTNKIYRYKDGKWESINQQQPDWNVNDENDPAFIKNRPFYTTDPQLVELCNQTINTGNFIMDGIYGDDISYSNNYELSSFWYEGNSIQIKWGQELYNSTVKDDKLLGTGLYLGNMSIYNVLIESYGSDISFEDTGEPFMISISNDSIGIYTSENLGEIEFVIIINGITTDIKMDEKYLPINVRNNSGENSIILNDLINNIASGKYSHAEGCRATASGTGSHAEGSSTIASGTGTHAEGWYTKASGAFGSHAEGYATEASGTGSHAEGNNTIASGEYSHAEGDNTIANNRSINVIGEYNKYEKQANYYENIYNNSNLTIPTEEFLIGDEYTFDSNTGTFTIINPTSTTELVVGKYVITGDNDWLFEVTSIDSDTKFSAITHRGDSTTTIRGKYAHIVGNGTSDTKRSNAHTLAWDGTAWFANTVKVGGTSQDDENAKTLATTPDWNENDETSSSYIQNRPFYSTDPVETTIVEEQTLEGFSEGTYQTNATNIELIEGQTYDVVWDGTTYSDLVCYIVEGFNAIGAHFKENSGFDFTTCPFVIIYISSYQALMIQTDSTETSHTIKIISAISEVIQLPEKYISYKPGIKTTGTIYAIIAKDQDTGENVKTEVVAGIGAEIFNDYVSNIASGNYSHAEGSDTTASGYCSHAEGDGTTASGITSHAEGDGTTASGVSSHAEGAGTVASHCYAHAEGVDTKATGWAAHAEGYRTVAAGRCQHVQGEFNIEDTENRYVHIVGNGGDNGKDYSNAHTLDWEGNAWFAGNVFVGGTSQDDATVEKLATESYVDRPRTEIILQDSINGYNYIVQMQNGTLISFCECNGIEIAQMPDNLEYFEGDEFDTTGLIINATCPDGNPRVIENYTIEPNSLTADTTQVVIKYVENGKEYTVAVDVNVKSYEEALIDFNYTVNEDGTYTINSWKGTLNGEPSTEIVIPNSSKIIV